MALTQTLRPTNWPAAPYKGLTYYTDDDAALFAGRADDVVRCGALLADWKLRLLLLHGSTGCGKSSFLRAGLIPYLESVASGLAFARAGGDPRSPVVFVRATADPLLMLADAVHGYANRVLTLDAPDGPFELSLRDALPPEATDVAAFRRLCAADAELLLGVLERLSRLVPETLVLVLDQGEEVLTVDLSSEGERCRRRFFDFVGDFVSASLDLRLVIALRTEYFGRFVSQARRRFRGAGIGEYFLDTLSREQVEDAILRPTSTDPERGAPFEHYRFSYEPDVVRAILDAIVDPGSKLSAVQIVCTALYEAVRGRAEPRRITLQDLEQVGGVEGAIERFIDQQIRAHCYDSGLNAGQADAELRRWKDALFALTRLQPDGTVTTELLGVSAFHQALAGTRLDPARAIARFASDGVRLLRQVDVVNTGTGALVPCIGLGHDALGLVLRNWKQRADAAAPDIATFEPAEPPEERLSADGIALCLSGGGFRAMLFHLGALWRLNELGYLRKLELVSAVSAGAMLAAHVATCWRKLEFGPDGVALNFAPVVAEPIRALALMTIDVPSVMSGVKGLFWNDGAGPLEKRLARALYGEATLQDWPDTPRFVVSATNVQCGSLFSFSKQQLADARLGTVRSPRVAVATAVAASGAVPPVLSPMVLTFAPTDWSGGSPPDDERFRTTVQLADGTVYDHFGLEPAWNRCRTILVSDAGSRRSDEPDPARGWMAQLPRLFDLVTFSGRALRKRQIIEAFASGQRGGTYWSISSEFERIAAEAGPPGAVDAQGLDTLPARYAVIDPATQARLINWGYAVCAAMMRRDMGAADVASRPPCAVG